MNKQPVENIPYHWVTPLAILAACIAGYYITLNAGFLADDFVIMHNINNGLIMETGTGGAFFRPLVWLTFSLNWFIFNHQPLGFHLFNLALHIIASLGVAACASYLFRNGTAGLIAGLVFALHPAHPEAVVWIAGRYDVMTCALLVWSLYFHLQLRDADVLGRPFLRFISLLLFGLACFSKETAFIFPVAVIFADLIPARDSQVTASVRRAIPLFILAAIIFILRWIRVGGIGGGDYVPGETLDVVSSNVFYNAFIQPFYILIFPFNLPLFKPLGALGIIGLGSVLISPLFFLFSPSKWRMAIFCGLSIIVCALPTAYMGLFEETLRNSRFLYIPSIFFAILVAGLVVSDKWKERTKKIATFVIVIYLTVAFLCLQQNNTAWQNAGDIVQAAAVSADEIIERHKGEWGLSRHNILAVNLPNTHLGALAFDWGFGEMLRLRHPDELDGVEIEVIHSPFLSPENVRKIQNANAEGVDVWLFLEDEMVFIEGFP